MHNKPHSQETKDKISVKAKKRCAEPANCFFYGKHHKDTIERDKRRKQEIIDFLKCKFIEIYEDNFNEK